MMATRQQEVDEIKQVILEFHGSGPEMAKKIRAQEAQIKALSQVLLDLEWSNTIRSLHYCPICTLTPALGHLDDCEYTLLRDAGYLQEQS